MRERGSALFVAVVSVMVLLLISGVFFSLITDQMKSNTFEERAIKSYYLAQAGIFAGVATIKAGHVPAPDSNRISIQAPVRDPFDDLDPDYGGQYSLQWQKSADGLYYTITSTGSYGSGTGKVDRILQAYYKVGSGSGEFPVDIISQAILTLDDKGKEILGQGQTMFVFSNSPPPLVIIDNKFPAVKLNLPIYIYTVKDTGSARVFENATATSVRLSLMYRNDEGIDQIMLNSDGTEMRFPISNFQGVSGINPDSTGTATPVSITYTGNKVVHLVVEGSITIGAPQPWNTGTISNYILVSSDNGLIWQIENPDESP